MGGRELRVLVMGGRELGVYGVRSLRVECTGNLLVRYILVAS